MNLSQLEVLVAIVDTGNMTEAAEVVGLTQSAVSYSVSRLEAELGVTLLERGRQGVHATGIGADVIQHARSILNQIEAIRQKAARERGLTVGKLRFGCVPTVPPRLLTGILRDFQQRYPDIDTVLFEGTPRELIDWLESGVIDIGTVTQPERYGVSSLFVQAEVVALLPNDHPLAAQAALSLEELTQEPLIGPKAEYGSLSLLLGSTQRSFPRLRHEVSTSDTIFAMVREHMGIALVLKMLVDPDTDRLTTRPLIPRLDVQIHLAAHTRSPVVEAFMESASNWAKGHGFSSESA
ncbi:MAG: LysR family transcriptional regulator [Anaerolinea sp.]|nr:LysR family transcriptional regulator [Anaerolinea sp.]